MPHDGFPRNLIRELEQRDTVHREWAMSLLQTVKLTAIA
jgi:hypothetical protein